jgi:hypothetical protein
MENMKNHELIQPPFQGLAIVTVEYIQILLTFFKTKLDGNLQQKWSCSPQYLHRRDGKRKENATL